MTKRATLLCFVGYLSLASAFTSPVPYRIATVYVPRIERVILFESSVEDNELASSSSADRTSGLLVLVSVPLVWGTYSPVVKYLYEVEPKMPGIVFSAAYYIVASILLTGLSKASEDENEDDTDFPFQGGIELGAYLFIATALQVKGLETVRSDRAGFFMQFTTIMVPFMQAVMNRVAIPSQTWVACLLALCGIIAMGLDGTAASNSNFPMIAMNQGDLLIFGAAVLFSLHVVRLDRYATQSTALKLAASKATTQAVLSIGVVSALFLTDNGNVATFFGALISGINSGTVTLSTLTPAIAAIFWTGCVTCAYTIYAQSYGQARVGPTEANLLYTMLPIFTAIFGYLLLGETLGSAGFWSAVLFAAAVYRVASKQNEEENEGFKNDDTTADAVSEDLLS